MDEITETRVLANKILDRINGDPDDDLAMLSRQLLRAHEQLQAQQERIAALESELASNQKYSSLCEDHAANCKRGHMPSVICVRCLLTQAVKRYQQAEASLQSAQETLQEQTKKLGEIRQLQFKGASVHCYGSHVPPDVESCQQNAVKEPQGERLRNELEAWLIDNKIVGILMDTKDHFVSIDCAPKLPPNTRPVLTHWGAIRVETDEYGTYNPAPKEPQHES